MPKKGPTVIVLLMLLVLTAASAGAEAGENRAGSKASRPSSVILRENLAKLDLFMKAVNLAVVTLNSYISAFSSVLKEYKVIEAISVL